MLKIVKQKTFSDTFLNNLNHDKIEKINNTKQSPYIVKYRPPNFQGGFTLYNENCSQVLFFRKIIEYI